MNDPVVVESTLGLDRLLQNGLPTSQPSNSRSVRIRAPLSSSTSSSASDSERLRLTEALMEVPFSPKRPRNASPRAAPVTRNRSRPQASNHWSGAMEHLPHVGEENMPTPRPGRYPTISSRDPKPARILLQPPTPSRRNAQPKTPRSAMRPSQPIVDDDRNPFHDIVNQSRPRHAPPSSRSRLHLPDVTGLTSAVASPAKGEQGYMGYVDRNGIFTECMFFNI